MGPFHAGAEAESAHRWGGDEMKVWNERNDWFRQKGKRRRGDGRMGA
ncbi:MULTISPECIES: hypothetical protein [Geobacillus]|uniref:Uncharacterized protein n=1 Tax=Geobacillus zalihae TaxID=213419 RepID=A0A7H1RRT7_9BACL|nr:MULTISPECIES: hypothetical protein [Geobacillus]EPR30141.1 hypothetical protein I656_00169 [Geobacillus sp. WSUCF1]QNU16976.1 hypothetical protein IC807_10980 [Geobacillus zalihae]QNU26104.1 hypothetical protein IC806_07955 [Geobacillus zalihae]